MRFNLKKEEWGIKRICQGCGTKFYDFNKNPIICPACGSTFDINALLKKKNSSVSEEAEEIEAADDDEILDDDLIDDEKNADDVPLEEDIKN